MKQPTGNPPLIPSDTQSDTGYIVAALSSYHEFTGPEALAYDGPGTDAGNEWKVAKQLAAYDEDATLALNLLAGLPTCNGRLGATGMCLGGHLAFRAAFDHRVRAAVCYFATDIHSQSLGKGERDDSLARVKDITGELVMVRGFLLTSYRPNHPFSLDPNISFLQCPGL